MPSFYVWKNKKAICTYALHASYLIGQDGRVYNFDNIVEYKESFHFEGFSSFHQCRSNFQDKNQIRCYNEHHIVWIHQRPPFHKAY